MSEVIETCDLFQNSGSYNGMIRMIHKNPTILLVGKKLFSLSKELFTSSIARLHFLPFFSTSLSHLQ